MLQFYFLKKIRSTVFKILVIRNCIKQKFLMQWRWQDLTSGAKIPFPCPSFPIPLLFPLRLSFLPFPFPVVILWTHYTETVACLEKGLIEKEQYQDGEDGYWDQHGWTVLWMENATQAAADRISAGATKIYLAFHPSGVVKWVPAIAGRQRQVLLIPITDWTRGCAGKTVGSLENTSHSWSLLRWWFTNRRYIKCTYLTTLPYLTLPYLILILGNIMIIFNVHFISTLQKVKMW